MNLGEILAASVGLSLDVYAVAVCKGAKIRKIDGRKLAQMCLIFAGWQMCALLIGNLIMLVPAFAGESERFSLIWSGLSALIIFGIGFYMFHKGIHREMMFEQVEPWGNAKELFLLSLATSVDAFWAGIGFGFVDTSLFLEVLAIGIMTVLAVITGIVTGYRLGYEQKHKAQIIGGLILIAAGIEICITRII